MKTDAILFGFLLTGALHAQEGGDVCHVEELEAVEEGWAGAASVYAYLLPEDADYVQPTVTADHRWLHLEARYNYEDLDTGSMWLGYNLDFGSKLMLDLTPMVGGVFGSTTGVAPGYHCTLSWWRLELYSEGECVFDTGSRADSFFYVWSELTLSPIDWLRAGLVAQRTRVYESALEVQRGFLVGLNLKHLGIAGYVFNPDLSQPTYVLSIGVEF